MCALALVDECQLPVPPVAAWDGFVRGFAVFARCKLLVHERLCLMAPRWCTGIQI